MLAVASLLASGRRRLVKAFSRRGKGERGGDRDFDDPRQINGQDDSDGEFEDEDAEDDGTVKPHGRKFNTFIDLVDEKASVPWKKVMHLPLMLVPLYWEDRINFLASQKGEDIKELLIEEMSIHILIDTLLLTITAVPMFSNTLPMGEAREGQNLLLVACSQWTLAAITYLTFAVQLCAILSHAMLIFAFIEVGSSVFSKWVKTKIPAIMCAAQLHIFGFYSFMSMFLLWPLTTYQYPYNTICYMSTFGPVCYVMFAHGHFTWANAFGPWKCINPALKLSFQPGSKTLRAEAEKEAAILMPHLVNKHDHEEALDIDVAHLLEALGMGHYKANFKREKVAFFMLSTLSDRDFDSLGVAIGDKMRIRFVLANGGAGAGAGAGGTGTGGVGAALQKINPIAGSGTGSGMRPMPSSGGQSKVGYETQQFLELQQPTQRTVAPTSGLQQMLACVVPGGH